MSGWAVELAKMIQETLTLNNVLDVSSVFSNLITGACAFMGVSYLDKLKKKQDLALFSFWAHIKIRMRELNDWLRSDPSLISNLYSPELRARDENILTEDPDHIRQFSSMVSETLSYIKATPDQMPVYRGWTADYMQVISFLEDLIHYDICDSERYFKYSKDNENDQMKYCSKICDTMKRLCREIDTRQRKTERKPAKKKAQKEQITALPIF